MQVFLGLANPTAFAVGLALGSALTYLIPHRRHKPHANWTNLQRLRHPDLGDANSGAFFNEADAPPWLRGLFADPSLLRVFLREWEDVKWRQKSGWHGTDLIHNPDGIGVQVQAYFWSPPTLTLTGIVRFGRGAESHRGLCHGGAMTSLMDDLCGHICFVASSAPWCGATVQVNCKLMKPVRVGEVLKIVGRIVKRETKEKDGKLSTKVFISAELLGEDDAVYASLEGLSITPVVMDGINDEVSRREWVISRPLGRSAGAMRDNGWFF